jgi:effector-binding domain-containing protein
LVDLGLGIAEIGRYLEAETVHDVDVISEILGNRLDDAERELLELQRVVSLLKEPLNVVRNQMSNPVVKTVPRQRVLSVREKGSYEFTIGKLVGDLVRVVESPDSVRNFVRITGPFMTVYHDEGYVLDGADIEVCVPVSGRIVLDDPCVEMKNLDSVMVVSVVHKGGYDGMGYSYDRVLEYVQSNGIEITGCIRDVYLNDPNMVDPDDILTEIQIPIKE